jgi:hypothetical protein
VTGTLSKVNNEVMKHHCTLPGIVCDSGSQFDDCKANIYVHTATTYKRANERKHVHTYVRGHISMYVCMYRQNMCTHAYVRLQSYIQKHNIYIYMIY